MKTIILDVDKGWIELSDGMGNWRKDFRMFLGST